MVDAELAVLATALKGMWLVFNAADLACEQDLIAEACSCPVAEQAAS